MPRSSLLRAAKGVAPIPAILAAAAVVVFSVNPARAAITTSPLAPPLGACSGTQCPSTFPPPNNGDFPGRDASINVFAGGNFSVTATAAEAEGKVVVLGDMAVAKTGGGAYNIGVAIGSRVPPPDGADYLTVGGNLTVNSGNTLIVGGSDSHTTAWGNVRYAGTHTVNGAIDIAPTGALIHDTNATSSYAQLLTVLEDRSTCAAKTSANGTVTVIPSQVTFTGDGTSALQVFDVPGNIGTASAATGIVFQNIPAGATVVVNMLGAAPVINTYSGSGQPDDPLTALGPKLLWNFPTATSATISGSAQFQGSVLTGNPAGTLTLTAPGINGRVYAAGNIVHAGSGSELHAYPFNGSIPDCTSSPSPSPSTTTASPSPSASIAESPTEAPSESATPSKSATESESPSASESPSPSESPSESPTESSSPSSSPSPSESPSESPSKSPSASPSESPSESPTTSPSPSESSSGTPSTSPSPSETPSQSPPESPSESESPTASASTSEYPSLSPSKSPSQTASAPTSTSTSAPTSASTSPSQPGQPHPQPSNPGGANLAHTGANVEGLGTAAALLLIAGTSLAIGMRHARRTAVHRRH